MRVFGLGRRRLLKVIIYSAAEFIVITLIVLLVNAARIRALQAGQGTEISLGPMRMIHVEKYAMDSGYSLAFEPYLALWLILLGCFVVEILIMVAFSHDPGREAPPEDN